MVNTLEKASFDQLRPGIKVPVKETILTPRFYTTDFEAMARMDISENEAELKAILDEFRSIIIVIILSGTKNSTNPGNTSMVRPANYSLNS